MKTKLFTLAIAALSIGLLSSCEKDDPTVSITGVTLEPATLEVTVGDADVKLTATVAPENATNKTVSWSSDKTDVATVDNEGNVHAVAAGSATITVTTTDGGKTATCAVIVKAALPEGALPGVFTVNAEGKKVHFSQGNLYYDGSNWGFEAEQYYFRTYDGKGKCDAGGYNKDSGTTSGHWGLFGWVGASSTTFTTSPEIYGVSTNTSSSSYGNVSGEAHKADWGTAIDNKGTWTTLTGGDNGEWKYLFDNHVNVWGTCNNVPGCFIAPDGYEGDATALSTAISDWESAQAAGIVFLPAASNRNGSSVSGVGVSGCYWSSTAYGINYAYRVRFTSSSVSPDSNGTRGFGYSVRLITESK